MSTPCTELGRVARCYVSAYQRNRIHESRLMMRERSCLTADFVGALPQGRTIASVLWSCINPYICNMQQADADPTETSVVCLFQYAGTSIIRCIATLDNGEQMVQQFRARVQPYAWFQGDENFSQGPYNITATVAA